ncbi:hypothetical protein DFJ73DRAFT_845563 [Zopfochytrium polystomum]|nr:hypothetical protein DFJ73DRAFT_845563 [Zopfochytrium polystomum]
MHLLNVAAADNHLRLVERLFRLGDAPTGFTYHKTLRNDRDDVLRLIAARSPLYFPKNGKASQLAYAAGFGALKCLRFMFGLLPRDRYADLVFGAVSRMCEDLNVNGLRGLLELEVEFREAGRPSAMEAAGDEAERAVEGLLEEARRGFFYYANLRDPSEVLKEFLGCVKLVVSLGVSPTLALQVVSDVKSWLAANGGSGDEVPELTRSEIREILGED